jgi:stress response protein YsnF
VKEEVRAHKKTRMETRDVSGEVRKEDIEVKHDRKERRK